MHLLGLSFILYLLKLTAGNGLFKTEVSVKDLCSDVDIAVLGSLEKGVIVFGFGP